MRFTYFLPCTVLVSVNKTIKMNLTSLRNQEEEEMSSEQIVKINSNPVDLCQVLILVKSVTS